MLISQLPLEIRERAQQCQKEEKDIDVFIKNTDDLGFAFDWEETDEGWEYWNDFYKAKNPNEVNVLLEKYSKK